MFKLATFLILALALAGNQSLAGYFPGEPEKDNREYVLDEVTNYYSYLWREIWENGDNRLRFRFGSNNVREWRIEEELKFSASMLSRLRFRFYHSRILAYTTQRWIFNTLELEGKIFDKYYFSFYAMPTEFKSDNTIGFIWQRRTAVDRFLFLYLELPRFMNNFTEHHKDTSDSLLWVYSRPPVKIGIEAKENLSSHFRFKLSGYFTNTFELSKELAPSGSRQPLEKGNLYAAAGRFEYMMDESKSLLDQSVAGIKAAYSRRRKWSLDRTFNSSPLRNAGIAMPGEDLKGDSGPQETDGPAQDLRNVIGNGARKSTGLGQGFPYIDIGHSFFAAMENDSVVSWEEERKFISPYAWIIMTERFGFQFAIRYETFALNWKNKKGAIREIKDRYLVPMLGIRLRFGDKRASILESGLVAEFRRRTEEVISNRFPAAIERGDFHDYRLYIAYEYFFKPDKAFRIVESLDLDREDWGQFSAHDHGFFQLIVGF